MSLYLLPISINLLSVFADAHFIADWHESLFFCLINGIVFPIYFVYVAYSKYNPSVKSFFENASLLLFLNCINSALQYIRWGLDSGNLLHPDSATMSIIYMEMKVSIAVTIVGLLVVNIVKRKHKANVPATKDTGDSSDGGDVHFLSTLKNETKTAPSDCVKTQ